MPPKQKACLKVLKEEMHQKKLEMEAKEHRFHEELVEAVRARPCLYAKKDPKYCDAGLKKKEWLKIAIEVGCPAGDCIKTWNSLKGKFRLERKTRMNPSGAGSSKRKAFPLYDAMLFMNEHIQVRRSRSTLGEHEGSSDDETQLEETAETEDTQDEETQDQDSETQFEIYSQSLQWDTEEGTLEFDASQSLVMEIDDEELAAMVPTPLNKAKRNLSESLSGSSTRSSTRIPKTPVQSSPKTPKSRTPPSTLNLKRAARSPLQLTPSKATNAVQKQVGPSPAKGQGVKEVVGSASPKKRPGLARSSFACAIPNKRIQRTGEGSQKQPEAERCLVESNNDGSNEGNFLHCQPTLKHYHH